MSVTPENIVEHPSRNDVPISVTPRPQKLFVAVCGSFDTLPALTWNVLTDVAENVSNGAIFRNVATGEPLKSFPAVDWRELLREARIENLTFHNLRATVGTEMILDGVSPFGVQKALGHKRITTTQRYVRIADDILQVNLEKQSEKYKIFVKEKEK